MKKIILRIFAALIGVFFGNATYFYYSNPEWIDGRTVQILVTALLCFIFLYYAITGNRKPFFPKWPKPFKRK